MQDGVKVGADHSLLHVAHRLLSTCRRKRAPIAAGNIAQERVSRIAAIAETASSVIMPARDFLFRPDEEVLYES